MFTDRRDAGLQLAEKLKHYKSCKGVFVLALPRGGAVPGFEIARAIGAPLDVLIVRKVGFPGQLAATRDHLWIFNSSSSCFFLRIR